MEERRRRGDMAHGCGDGGCAFQRAEERSDVGRGPWAPTAHSQICWAHLSLGQKYKGKEISMLRFEPIVKFMFY